MRKCNAWKSKTEQEEGTDIKHTLKLHVHVHNFISVVSNSILCSTLSRARYYKAVYRYQNSMQWKWQMAMKGVKRDM